MLDPDDEQIIQDCKAAGAVFVTFDRVTREAAGAIGMTPYEVMQKAKEEAPADTPPEAIANLDRLIQLTPEKLTAMAEAGKQNQELFEKHIRLDTPRAKLVRHLRVTQSFSWRAVARRCALLWEAPWGANQLAGMALCEKAAKLLGEDFLKEPWN